MNKKKLAWQLPFLAILIIGTIIILKKQAPFRTDEGFVFGTVYKITYQSEDILIFRNKILNLLRLIQMKALYSVQYTKSPTSPKII